MAKFDKSIKITKDFLEKSGGIYIAGTDFLGHILDQKFNSLNFHPQCMPLPCFKIPNEKTVKYFDPNIEEDKSMINVFLDSISYTIQIKPNTKFYVQDITLLDIDQCGIAEWLKNNLEETLGKYNNVIFLWDKQHNE